MALVSLSEVKTHGGITGTADDALLNQLIDGASTYIETETAVDFSVKQRVDNFFMHSGDGVLVLRHLPVISISSVTQDDAALDVDDMTIDKDLGILRLATGTGAIDNHYDGDIIVTYLSGYTSVPKDIKLAVNEMIIDIFENAGSSGLRSARMGDYSFTRFSSYAEEGVGALVTRIINKYRLIS